MVGLLRADYGRGRLREARAKATNITPLTAARYVVAWYLSDAVEPQSAAAAAPQLASSGTAPDRFLLGAMAARQGEWSAAEGEARRLLEGPIRAADREDSLLVNEVRALGVALRGYIDLARFRRTMPTERLRGALAHVRTNGPSLQIRDLLRYEFGRARLQSGDLEEARVLLEPLATSGYPNIPTADLWLGRVYARLGRREEARARYARFIERLRDCDPELRPLVDEARLELARLEEARAAS